MVQKHRLLLKHINKHIKKRLRKDTNFRIKKRMQTRIYFAVKSQNTKKTTKTIELLGCNLEFFQKYLKENLRLNLRYEDYGKTWHIHHKKACFRFDLTDPEQQKQCFHYTNLIPMEIKQHRKITAFDLKMHRKKGSVNSLENDSKTI